MADTSDTAPTTADAWQLCHELAVYHEDHIGQLTHLLERTRPFRTALAQHHPTDEDDLNTSLTQLTRNNLKMSEACLSVRDAATTFMRSRGQRDLEILEHTVGHLNHLPETLCPISFNIVRQLDRAEQQLITMRKALEQSTVALNAWLHQYAPECCDHADVATHNTRIADQGGTLTFIATVLRTNRMALTPVPTNPFPTKENLHDSHTHSIGSGPDDTRLHP